MTKMTYEEMVEALFDMLSLVKGQFRANPWGQIRHKKTGACPLCAIATKFGLNPQDSGGWPGSTDMFNLEADAEHPKGVLRDARANIMLAADSPHAAYRKRLEEVLGIV